MQTHPEKAEEPANINVMLWQLLHRSSRAVVRVRQKELDNYGITVTGAAVLETVIRLVKSGERPTPTEVARLLFLEANSVSEQLKRMAADGLIRKVKDLNRKNLVRIEVTERGYKLYRDTLNQKSIDAVMSLLTDKQKEELWSLLTMLRERAVNELGLEEMELYPPSAFPGKPDSTEALSHQ